MWDYFCNYYFITFLCCAEEFWKSWHLEQQRSGGRVGDHQEQETAALWRPLVDIRLQPSVQAPVWRGLHVRSAPLCLRRDAAVPTNIMLPLQVRPVCDLRWLPDAAPGAVRPVAVPKPSRLFHLTTNGEDGLHRFHGHLLIHLHAPQHGRTHIPCCQGRHEVDVLMSQSGDCNCSLLF